MDDEGQPPFVRQPGLCLEEGDLHLRERCSRQAVKPRLAHGNYLRVAEGGLQCFQRMPLLPDVPRVQAHGVEVSRLRAEVRRTHADHCRAGHLGQAVGMDVEKLYAGCFHVGDEGTNFSLFRQFLYVVYNQSANGGVGSVPSPAW